MTGEILWRSRPLEALYSTPQFLRIDGKACIAVCAQSGLAVVDAADRAVLHFHGWRMSSPRVNAATPVVVEGERLFISSGYGSRRGPPRFLRRAAPGALGDESDADGPLRLRALGMGSLMAAGDRLILLSADGELVIASVAGDEFVEQSRVLAFDGANNGSSPVLADGRIYCRNGRGDLVCFDRRPHPSEPGGTVGTRE